jgi:GNAT superfamily N-acetyltransferase
VTPPLSVRPIRVDQALSIRHPILRPGLPVESAMFPEDDDAQTLHLGAYEAGRLFAVATFFPEAYAGRPGASAYRLRGIATLEAWRGRGGGSALVHEGLRLVREAGAELVWCHARLAASGFYEKLGFAAEGATFERPHSGWHVVMVRTIETPR